MPPLPADVTAPGSPSASGSASGAVSGKGGSSGVAPASGGGGGGGGAGISRTSGGPSVRKTSASEVLVISFGSLYVRYGLATDRTPRKIQSLVAFPRSSTRVCAEPSLRAPAYIASQRRNQDEQSEFKRHSQKLADELLLCTRRIGGGKPVPWNISAEEMRVPKRPLGGESALRAQMEGHSGGSGVRVGVNAQMLERNAQLAANFDLVAPVWDGKLIFGDAVASDVLVRAALDALLRELARELLPRAQAEKSNGNESVDGLDAEEEEEGERYIAIVVPDTAHRRDVAEIVDAIFRVDQLRAGAVFVQQSSVACALGAGLATCAVVDIGHSSTTVACIEEGTVCGDSRVRLRYGAYHMLIAFETLLQNSSVFMESLKSILRHAQDNSAFEYDFRKVAARLWEQLCTFKTDDNDTLAIANVTTPDGASLRVKCGLAFRALPAHGLIHPQILLAAVDESARHVYVPERAKYERNADDDNFMDALFSDQRRTAAAASALALGHFSNEVLLQNDNDKSSAQQQESALANNIPAAYASIIDAIAWSVLRAVNGSAMVQTQPARAGELQRRFCNAIVLSGGGASADGIALALEAKIKNAFAKLGHPIADVTIIDGGKGKGDEEFAAAAALVREKNAEQSFGDDTDTASLPWKGCAVMVEADAISDYWLTKKEWQCRHVRALREKVPFYW